jgi:hypothetical protein
VLAVAALASAGPPHTALSVAPFSNIRAAGLSSFHLDRF